MTFWDKIKLNLSSFKTWMFLLPFVVSTIVLYYLVYNNLHLCNVIIANNLQEHQYMFIQKVVSSTQDMFIAWCTFNVSLSTVIISAREMFKSSKLKALLQEGKVVEAQNIQN